MEYLEAWGTLIHEKNLKLKISCQTSFKRSTNTGSDLGDNGQPWAGGYKEMSSIFPDH